MRHSLLKALIFTPTLVGVFLFGLAAANAHRIALGVTVADIELAGVSADALPALLTQKKDTWLDAPLTLTFETLSVTTTPRALGVDIEKNQTASSAWQFGRGGGIASDLSAQVKALAFGRRIAPAVLFSEETFHNTLDEIVAPLDRPARNATLSWDATREIFLDVIETQGGVVERQLIRTALLSHAETLTPLPRLPLTLVDDYPTVTRDALPHAHEGVDVVFAELPRKISAGDETLKITKRELGPLLAFVENAGAVAPQLKPSLDRERTKEYLEREIASRVNREPVNAKFVFSQGRVKAFALARNGQNLEMDPSILRLEDAVLKNSPPAPEAISLAVTVTKPEIGNDAAEALGIRELLTVGETDFKGSPQNRMHNIRVGASRFSGVLVKPGEEFSFNTILGAVGPETGYKPELVIKQDQTVPEYGGGLCQVSTTAFRAAAAAGLEITARRSHAYIVRYYGTPGFDATIYPPNPDFRFINNTPGHILIQTNVSGTKLRFEFYGTNDGRTVDIIGPRVYDQKPDGSAKATLVVRTTSAAGAVREQKFNSTYRSPSLYPVERRNPLE